jgi:alcohol dehydrogenase
MADYCALPTANLKPVPPGISNERGVFVEPLSAACEILEQVSLHGHEKVVVLGDGRLGILCAWVLSTAVRDITLVGHHPEKLTLAAWQHLKVALDTSLITAPVDVVIEATGRPDGLQDALALCRARGTIVLKSTLARSGDVNLASMVVNEQTMIGSRCGRFEAGLHLLEAHPDLPLERLITARYPLEQGVAAFARANAPGALKVLLDINA